MRRKSPSLAPSSKVFRRALRPGLLLSVLSVLMLNACPEPAARGPEPDHGGKPPPGETDPPVKNPTEKLPAADGPAAKKVQPALAPAAAPAASPTLDLPEKLKTAAADIDAFFGGRAGQRAYLQVDKPIYKPGETIWIKSWVLQTKSLIGQAAGSHRYQLKSPKGAVVLEKNVQAKTGYATNDLILPEGAQGGEYTLVLHSPAGMFEKTLVVSSYEPPRIKKKLEFVRKAYGPGDLVAATIVVKRPTGEPLANQRVKGRVRLDGEDLDEVSAKTNADGGALIRVRLPKKIDVGDGLLTVLIEDGGITESISKRVPIVVKKLRLTLFPEGGSPIEGLENRVYFEAKNPLGKPADIEGHVVDDIGNTVARLRSHWGGLGRFAFKPQAGRTYKVAIDKPAGVKQTFDLPLAASDGCTLHHFDDLDGQQQAVRVRVACSSAKKVAVVGVQRGSALGSAYVQVDVDEPAIVHLKPEGSAALDQGVARVTVVDEQGTPLAERLVYRNRRHRLQVEIKPNRKSYMPRDQVALSIVTKNAKGEPVPAELALSVVDDTVVSFADDKSGHMLSRLLLEPEIPQGKDLEEPKFFFDLTEDKSALALDLLMGTKGFRRLQWQPVWGFSARRQEVAKPTSVATGFGKALPPSPAAMPVDALQEAAAPRGGEQPRKDLPRNAKRPRAKPEKKRAVAKNEPVAPEPVLEREVVAPQEGNERANRIVDGKGQAKEMPAGRFAGKAGKKQKARRRLAQAPMEKMEMEAQDDAPAMGAKVAAEAANKPMAADADFDRAAGADKAIARKPQGWAVVRVFPAPSYGGVAPSGPRTDFRETLHWAPSVRTDRHGSATVSFFLSDAVTSFRVFAEGAGGGQVGRTEKVIKSSLPFSLAVKLPLEVSSGDKIRLPVILSNERPDPLSVSLDTTFGSLLKLNAPASLPSSLAPNARNSMVLDVDVTGVRGKVPVTFAATAGGLKDEVTRHVKIEPLGFPQEGSASGTVKAKAEHSFNLKGAEPGTPKARVTFYPSPTATMISGLDALLRQPSGCFEQASSSNYPNVMILQHLQSGGIVAPDIMARAQGFLDSGYQKLTGYESPKKGYEWFGSNPGHEALTAYGLLEFVDMKEVYSVDQAMIDRTANWLMSRRDGKGGFLRNKRALDSFGRASDEVTNGYITWALSEAGYSKGLKKELEVQAAIAKSTQDAYLLALAANSLLNDERHRAAGKKAAARLAKLQDKDGSFKGANHSVTRSGGQNLVIESTSLATLALLKAGKSGPANKAVNWLMKNRGGYGQWGTTQATILALRALVRFAKDSRKTDAPGSVIVKVNGKVVARQNYEAGHKDPMVLEVSEDQMNPGPNDFVLLHDGQGKLPYSVAIEWRTKTPASSEQAVVELTTSIEKTELKMGDTVRAWATVKNKTSTGQPMTLVRVGLPGGLTFQNWQLKELREQKKVGFYETRPREVILYFRALGPGEERKIPLDLVATVPGIYTGPASSAYLYYTDEHKVWNEPFRVDISQ